MSNRKRDREPSFQNVVNILEKGSCVLCSMLKRFHSAYIQDADVNHIKALCDFHAWAISGAGDAKAAAEILLRLLLLDQQRLLPEQAGRCSVCERMAQEEIKRSDELFLLLKKNSDFQSWIRNHGALCLPHARRLLKRIPDQDRHVILALVAQAASKLKNELRAIADNPSNRRSSIVLSQAAEFLKGRRGLVLDN